MKKPPSFTKEEAINRNEFRYLDITGPCDKCHMVKFYRYVSNDECQNCALIKEKERIETTLTADSISMAQDLRHPSYVRYPKMCKKGPHLHHYPVIGTGCYVCKVISSQRLWKGKDFYKPMNKCQRCGTRCRRHSGTDICTGCEKLDMDIKLETVPPYHGKRATAKMLNFKQYITEKPCSRGHTTGRYTSNGMCVECTAINGVKRLVPLTHRQIMQFMRDAAEAPNNKTRASK